MGKMCGRVLSVFSAVMSVVLVASLCPTAAFAATPAEELFGAIGSLPGQLTNGVQTDRSPSLLAAGSVNIDNATIDYSFTVDSGVNPIKSIKYNGNTLVADKDYTVDLLTIRGYDRVTSWPTASGTYVLRINGTSIIGASSGYYGTRLLPYSVVPSLERAKVGVAGKQVYTGQALQPGVTVTLDGATVPAGTYRVTYANNVKAGTAKVTVTGTLGYTGTATGTFTIAKATNPLKLQGLQKSLKASRLETKSQKFKGVMVKAKGAGKTTYKLTKTKKAAKWFSVAKTTGKVTAKQGTPKGSYTLKVKVKAAGNANYKASTKSVKVKVRVR